MDIKTAFGSKHSKEVINQVVNYIGQDTGRFAELMEYFFSKDNRLSQRASWAVSNCVERYPALIDPYLEEMIAYMSKPVHNAIKRNAVRILEDIDIPEHLLGEVAEICFEFLNNPKEAIAVRVFSMTVLLNICKKEPDLGNELRLVIEDHYDHGSAGFQSRGRKVLKELNKICPE